MGYFYADKYQFIGIKAICENCYILTAFFSFVFWYKSWSKFSKKSENFRNSINEYVKKIEDDKELYDSHKDDAKYICKFLFESKLRTLGISGEYGVGKSKIMKTVKKVTESDSKLYVEISPLSCSIEEMPTYIIGQIERVLKDKGIYTNNTRQIINTIQNGYLSSLLNTINDNQTLSDLYKNLRDLIKKQDIQLTIIVDDLDRIYDKKQIQAIFIILDAIVSEDSEDSDNCKIVYLYDAFVLDRIFKDDGGSKYIEKYIQIEYPLKDLTFRDLVKIENDKYINNNDTPMNKSIYKVIDNEIGSIEFGTKIYGCKKEYLVFDIRKLTPREINKIIKMSYEKLSNKEYAEAIKGFERLVFRYFVTIFYYPKLKQQITNIKDIDKSLIFKYDKEKMSLSQVLGKFFSVTKFGGTQTEEQYNEYMNFIKKSNNFDKLLALNLLGYDIGILRKSIENESEERAAFKQLNQQEQIYNRFYRKVDGDDFFYRDYYNEKKIIAVISNLINESYSEYTDDEWFAKHFKANVLDKADILDAHSKYAFKSYKDNTKNTYPLSTSMFDLIRKAEVKNKYWNKLMELYYKYLLNDDKIIFDDIILTNICIFGFVSYRASIYAFMIISKFDFSNYENKYIDVISIPKIIELIKGFLENNFGMTLVFSNPVQEKWISIEDIDECKRYLPSFKSDLQNFIKHLDELDVSFTDVMKNDLLHIRNAIEKLIDLIDNAHNYKDSIERNYVKTTINYIPRDISKYKGKTKEDIDKMFDEDIDNNILRPTDYKRIMDEFNNE